MQEDDRVTRVLVTGARGQLGSRLLEFGARRKALQVVGLDRTDLDITDPSSIQEALVKHTPDVVINAAAYTAVDLAESEQERAFAVNGAGVKHLAEACRQNQVALIHVSTDYVFGEVERVPLDPSEPTSPLGVYGASKLDGEEAFSASGVCGAVVRVAWLYDARGNNFLTTMVRLAQQHGRLNVVNDQHGVPTSAPALAEALLDMAERGQDIPRASDTTPTPATRHGMDSQRPSWGKLACTSRSRPSPLTRSPQRPPGLHGVCWTAHPCTRRWDGPWSLGKMP